MAVFEKLALQGETIICPLPSAEVSGTVRSAITAKEALPDADIRIIDTRIIAGTAGEHRAGRRPSGKKWRQRGSGRGADPGDDAAGTHLLLGRHTGVSPAWGPNRRRGGLGGSILQIKPILTFTDGRIEPFEKERTRSVPWSA